MKTVQKSTHFPLVNRYLPAGPKIALSTGLLLLSLLLGGCGILKSIGIIKDTVEENTDKVVSVLDDAIRNLNNTSADWQGIVQQALNDLPSDVQSTIRTEITDLLNRGVAATGVEFRCNADFIRNRVSQGLQRIKAKVLGGNPPPIEPSLCQVVPLAVDMALAPERRNKVEFFGYDFDMAKVKVFLVNGTSESEVTQFLDQPTHFHMTLNLGGSGIHLTDQSKRLILRWNNQTISTIAILQEPPKVCQTTFANKDNVSLSFIPRHTRGDREYDGNGPDISCSVRLINVGTRVDAEIYMLAKETESDWTTAEGTQTFTVYTPDPGFRVESIVGATAASFAYRDNDHIIDRFSGNGPVAEFAFSGDDEGNDAGVHTGVTIKFNRIRLQLKETSDCVPTSTLELLVKDGLIAPSRLNQIKAINPNITIAAPVTPNH